MASDDDGNDSLWTEFRAQRDILVELRTLLKENIKAKDDHETRIRRLEERKFPLPAVGILIAIASMATAIIPLLTHH